MEIDPIDQGGPLVPITALATLTTSDGSAVLVLGDATGRLRVNRFRSDNNAVDRDEYLNLQLRTNDGSVPSIVCIEPLGESLLAVSTRQIGGEANPEQRHSGARDVNLPVAQGVHIIDLASLTCKVALNGHRDVVHALCLLPDGSLATCGGKMDAKTRVWDLSKLQNEMTGNGADTQTWTEDDSRELEEVGYVFGLAVLPDTKPGSQHYALAAARYNVVRMCI